MLYKINQLILFVISQKMLALLLVKEMVWTLISIIPFYFDFDSSCSDRCFAQSFVIVFSGIELQNGQIGKELRS